MERQKVDVPMAVDSNDSGQDSGHLVNPFMRATLRVSLELPLFTSVCVHFIT